MNLPYCYSFLLGITFLGSLISSPRPLVPNWDTLRFLLCITGLVHQLRSLTCLIPLLVSLVISWRFYTYVLGLNCLATLVALHFDIWDRILVYVLFVFKELEIP